MYYHYLLFPRNEIGTTGGQYSESSRQSWHSFCLLQPQSFLSKIGSSRLTPSVKVDRPFPCVSPLRLRLYAKTKMNQSHYIAGAKYCRRSECYFVTPNSKDALRMLRNAQITRVRHSDGSQALKQIIDGTTIPYSGPNLTTMLSGVTNSFYVPKGR
jgi:hypothetical protein